MCSALLINFFSLQNQPFRKELIWQLGGPSLSAPSDLPCEEVHDEENWEPDDDMNFEELSNFIEKPITPDEV
jgi:hypothetical protein